jgi:hypothetical protein
MFGSEILEIAIGIFFLYLLLSLFCSAINEWISRIFELRANNLREGIKTLLDDSGFKEYAKKVYDHALIKGLSKKGKIPSYIPSRTFAMTLLDIISPADLKSKPETFLEDIKKTVGELEDTAFKSAMLALLNDAGNSLTKARENIQNWFNDGMDRVSGWYKRKMQVIIMVLALVVSVAFNADTIMITNTLSQDAMLRQAIVAAAENATQQSLPNDIKQIRDEIDKLQLPLGWSSESDSPRRIPECFSQWLTKILGLLVTVLAVSLGAPFWFDIINKLVSLRSSGKVPEKKEEENNSSSK